MLNKPIQGFLRTSKRPEKIALFCYFETSGIRDLSTVSEFILYLQKLSDFPIVVVNMFEHKTSAQITLSSNFNFDDFDVVVIHNTLAYDVNNLITLDRDLKLKLKDFQGLKVLLKQDENYKLNASLEYLSNIKFDVVFTCLSEKDVSKVYPKELFPDTKFRRMLTGYISPSMLAYPLSVNRDRPIDIGYRGSIQDLSFGRLAYEKFSIGKDVSKLLGKSGLNLDISSRSQDRFGGSDWFNFLSSCKATLGVESGASIFDLNGELSRRLMLAEYHLGPNDGSPEYAENFLSYFADLEGNINYAQISPRHFEAASMGTLQILFPGTYSEIFVANKHYLPLERDFSNINDVIEFFGDDHKRINMTLCAYEEVVMNKNYHISRFAKIFDDEIFSGLLRKNIMKRNMLSGALNGEVKNLAMLVTHRLNLDPRLSWMSCGSPKSMSIHQIGIDAYSEPSSIANKVSRDNRFLLISTPPHNYLVGDALIWSQMYQDDAGADAAISLLLWIETALGLEDCDLLKIVGHTINDERFTDFKWYLRHILNSTKSLILECTKLRGLNGIIAVDFFALPAALIVAGIFKIPVIFDAHEYFPEADTRNLDFMKQFWMRVETSLLKHIGIGVTVSSGLAKLYENTAGVHFKVLPNAELLEKNPKPITTSLENKKITIFLFQGGFSENRGIDLLIRNWKLTSENAILYLRGPDSDYKNLMIDLAVKEGLFDTRIFFPAPVREDQLVEMAGDADVGLVPYAPIGENHKHCCPNKLSQFMAAAKPILANKTFFVSEILEKSGAGIVVDFNREDAFVEAINGLCKGSELRRNLGNKGREFFENYFNWESLSKEFYRDIEKIIQDQPPSQLKKFDSTLMTLENKAQLVFRSRNLNSNNSAATSTSDLIEPLQSLVAPVDDFFVMTEQKNNLNTITYKILKKCWHIAPSFLKKTLGQPALIIKNFLIKV